MLKWQAAENKAPQNYAVSVNSEGPTKYYNHKWQLKLIDDESVRNCTGKDWITTIKSFIAQAPRFFGYVSTCQDYKFNERWWR